MKRLEKRIAFWRILVHNVTVVIKGLIIIVTFIICTYKFNKERNYVREIVQIKREQNNC